MITRVLLNKAINDLIQSEFPGIPILNSDAEEGFVKPSFIVSIETKRMEASQYSTYREMICHMTYYPKGGDGFKEEAYNVMDRLEGLFGLNFAVEDRTITISEASTHLSDNVVYYDFSFQYYDSPEEAILGEPMQELRYER
ncbi:phage tail terminator family protein [Marinicrinis lubricantis]|uniref:DUF6838 family protein n=1 Tax=Marinicrinis lubricantis TaxID=2086470 RepID=A0ABW1IHE6_9BACL